MRGAILNPFPSSSCGCAMSAVYESEAEADKTAAPSLDLEKGGSDVHKTSVDDCDEKPESQSGHGHPDHDFRAEERDDIPAAVDPPHIAVGDYPDGGLTAWLVVVGVGAFAL